ncbi:hypothetical protein [uncultured Parasphingorhabdus sp.]|uniref:hypothetical protein n=1 Tax=uncultured Parasphingorhabdus sp. TaxID=2709694 RepID=UPI0030D971D3|tara:strand:- start:6487 stop:8592 length:2106 start_codon:yes stop_codon:yes gene_type:complete
MSGLSASFVPILAVMSGQAEQMETRRASVEDMEASLTALLAGERFAWISNKSADFGQQTGMGGPDPDEEEAETDGQDSTDQPDPKDASKSSNLEQSETPDQLEMDFDGPAADDALIDGRRRPGVQKTLPDRVTQNNPGAVNAPPPEAFPTDEFPVPDRWRIMQSLCPAKGGDESIYTLFGALRNNCHSTLNPYNQNVLKGDKPIPADKKPGFLKGDDWFFVANAISDTVIEPRSFPIPVGVQTTERPNSIDVFGRSGSEVYAQTFITGFALIKGSTAYKPPDVEYRLTLATQVNHVNVPERRVLFVEPSKSSHRTDWFVGVQEAFFDYHIRNTSARYDFDSFRIGIQPMQADFRGFLFQDNQLGFRLFGTRDNNRIQYNLGAFVQLEKDTNSGLNDITQTPRESYIFFANLYRQDLPFVGLTSQFSLTYNMNREKSDIEIDDNGFPVRPALLGDLRGRAYDVVYPGYAFDGRIGRINLTGQVYGAFGEDRNSFFTSEPAKIEAYFGALEASYDVDFLRFRASGLFASGDGNPYNNTEAGFDAIFENPIFAGADTSYWIRQTIPFAGGGRVISINGRNGILNSLRSSKEQGQSNFNNPGTILAGVGVDADLTPTFRLSGNANHLWFHKTEPLQTLRNEGSIPNDIGWDLSVAAIYRPKATQNMVFRLSGAALLPGKGFKDLFDQTDKRDFHYSILLNAIVAF